MRYGLILFFVLLIPVIGFAQNSSLAENYMDQGEYAKAASIYQKIFEENKNNLGALKGLTKALKEQENYKDAREILNSYLEDFQNHPELYVELGQIYKREENTKEAEKQFQKALEAVKKRKNFAYVVGETFEKHNLLDQAVQTYETALKERPNPNFTVQLARIYGEQGKLKKMFSTFLDLLEQKDRYYAAVNRNFSEYITANPENKANTILRKILMKRVQKNPKLYYNELLSWLYSQEKDFKKAFNQQKAIYKRTEDKTISNFFDLAKLARENDAVKDAETILNYAADHAKTTEDKIKAYEKLMALTVDQAEDKKDYKSIDREFSTIFKEFGKGTETLNLQFQYAEFKAFRQEQIQKAKSILSTLLDKSLTDKEEARTKMKLADILVAEKNFNQALIYYSQIKNLVNNSALANEAAFKVAKTSYYKGDFDWAQTQLNILKSSTSDLTANDAMALHLLINDNKGRDSTQTALKQFAKADLLADQQDNKTALSFLDSLLEKYKGEKIEDEALFRSARLYEKQGEYEKAETAYQKITEFYNDGILADDAYYYLAELYRTKLDKPDKAMENYKQIIFHHEDSIFFVDARKQYRRLRGDDIQ